MPTCSPTTRLPTYNDERCSLFYGLFYERPAGPGELPSHYGVPPGWEPHHALEAGQKEKDERKRMERMKHAGDRPPHRGNAIYGPIADNAAGDVRVPCG